MKGREHTLLVGLRYEVNKTFVCRLSVHNECVQIQGQFNVNSGVDEPQLL